MKLLTCGCRLRHSILLCFSLFLQMSLRLSSVAIHLIVVDFSIVANLAHYLPFPLSCSACMFSAVLVSLVTL